MRTLNVTDTSIHRTLNYKLEELRPSSVSSDATVDWLERKWSCQHENCIY